METPMIQSNETFRLERLWAGEFGEEYTNRNNSAFNLRKPFWQHLMRKLRPHDVLEVGCNSGGNLKWISPLSNAYGIDINKMALRMAKVAWPELNLMYGTARDLPFKDRCFDLTFTCGVLIHQPTEALRAVMREVVRTSRRYVLCMEYYAPKREWIHYRREERALFKDDFGGIYRREFKLKQLATGHLGPADGFDNVTWWLLERKR